MVRADSTVGIWRSATATLATSAGVGPFDPRKVLNRSRHWRQRNVWFCPLSKHRFRQKLLVIEWGLQLALFEFALRNLGQVAHIAVEHKRLYFADG